MQDAYDQAVRGSGGPRTQCWGKDRRLLDAGARAATDLVPGTRRVAPGHLTEDDEGTLSMWAFFSRRLRMWLLLAIALPLTRALVHRLALAAERRDPSTRTAKALHQADSAVTAVSRRAARKAERRSERPQPRWSQ